MNINEIRIKQQGSNDDEYFELFGQSGESLDGLTYVVIDSTSTNKGSGLLREAVSLEGQSFDANGFFVVAQDAFDDDLGTANLKVSDLRFPSQNAVTHLLVEGFDSDVASVGDDLDTNNNGTLDITPWTNIVDSVAFVGSNANQNVYSSTRVGPSDGSVPAHIFRSPDGTGSFQIGSFSLGSSTLADTPGATNSTGDGGGGTVPAAPVFVVSIDANDDGFISDDELNNQTTVTVTVTLASGSAVGDRIIVNLNGEEIENRLVTAGDIANGVTIDDIIVPPADTVATFTSTLTNDVGTSEVGTQTFTIGNPPSGSVPSTPVFAVSTDTDSDGFISDDELDGDTVIAATVTLTSGAAVGDILRITTDDGTVIVDDLALTAEDITDGVTIDDITVPAGTEVTFTSTLTNDAGTSSPGVQTITIGNPPVAVASAFTPSADGSTVELSDLDGTTAVRFNLGDIRLDNASEIRVFKVGDGEGETDTQLGAFSVLESGQLDSSFTPSLSLGAVEGDTLRFELVDEDGNVTSGVTSIGSDGNGILTFGRTTLSLSTDDGTGAPNLVVDSDTDDGDGAVALDFRGLAGTQSAVTFSVFREASFDSAAGLYIVDNLTGQVTDDDGTVFQVGEEGYAAAALSRAVEDLSLSASDNGSSSVTATIDNALFGMYITVEDTDRTYFSFSDVNPDDNDHVKLLGSNAFGFEDQLGLGDADFNDLVVSFEVSPVTAAFV